MSFIKDFYIYTLSLTAASGATATGNIPIQADSDFILEKLTYIADIANAGQTDSSRIVPLITVLITDSGSGRQLMSAAVPVPNIFGTGQIPFILPTPRLFKARANIAVSVANYDAADDYNIKLSFIGKKLFDMGN